MVYITHIHLAGGQHHEHIASVRWRNPSDQQTGQTTRTEMVDWIDNKNGDARVTDGRTEVRVGVVRAHPPYLRTHADGTWTDNLGGSVRNFV